jgi:tetracycline resistance efflux pump
LQKAAGLGWLALPIGIILMVATVVGIKVLTAGKEVAE